MVTVCKGCGKPINWIRTHGRKKMPVDIDAVPFIADRSGTEIFVRRDGSVTVGRRAEHQDNQAELGYTSHFATCPQGEMFRKTGRRENETEKQQQMAMLI